MFTDETKVKVDPANFGRPRFDRLKNDSYQTLDSNWIVPCLLSAYPIRGPVLEPMSGAGLLSDALEAGGLVVQRADLIDHGDLRCEPGIDFLETDFCGCKSIVSNPPFKIAEQVIAHALELTEPQGGQVAMLLRSDWGAAARRRPLLKEHPAFACKVELTKRPNWIAKAGGARFNYSWFVWDWQHTGMPVIRWAS